MREMQERAFDKYEPIFQEVQKDLAVDNIELQHHNALSDARACAELYLRR